MKTERFWFKLYLSKTKIPLFLVIIIYASYIKQNVFLHS